MTGNGTRKTIYPETERGGNGDNIGYERTELMPKDVGDAQTELMEDASNPATARGGRIYGDPAKTELMQQGFDTADETGGQTAPSAKSEHYVTLRHIGPVVGWVVVVKGPGRGHYRPLFCGNNAISRSDSAAVSLPFGDNRISRETHAFVVYDELGRKFFLRDTGQVNLVRLNGSVVMGPSELKAHDQISIGETVLEFVPFCTSNFDWLASDDKQKSND